MEPARLGALALRNRIVMAPMTRSRADDDGVPGGLHVEYYRQRASAGLIITEGCFPNASGKGYCRTPGIHTRSQIAGWARVAEAVHAEGGTIVAQIMHCGRVGTYRNKAAGADHFAPSALAARSEIFADRSGMVPMDPPRALETDEIAGLIEEFAQAAANAVEAGLDGVELHCASGYLPMQFLSSGTNRRADRYGGNATGRVRFVTELLEAMAGRVGAGRVGFRICPGSPFNDISDADPAETYSTLLDALSPLQLAYAHLIVVPSTQVDSLAVVRARWRGGLIVNNELNLESADEHVRTGAAAVSFGRAFIANPDLVHRLAGGLALADFDPATLYTPGPRGYTDYPPAPAESP